MICTKIYSIIRKMAGDTSTVHCFARSLLLTIASRTTKSGTRLVGTVSESEKFSCTMCSIWLMGRAGCAQMYRPVHFGSSMALMWHTAMSLIDR